MPAEAAAWVARFDTTALPDGPHVLAAVARPRGTGSVPAISRAFVLLQNAGTAAAVTSCAP